MTVLSGGKLARNRLGYAAAWLFSPALLRLLCYQAIARWQRLGQGFTARRRWVLSGLALLVGAVWLGNTLLAILLRDPADPIKLERFISLGILAYAFWHLVKTAYWRPEEAIEWTPAEQAWVCGGPFERRHLLVYRFGGIVLAAMLKAALFVLLLLPDLATPIGAFAGVLLALLFLELWRMAWEIVTWGVSHSLYLVYRVVVLTSAAGLLVAGIGNFMSRPINWQIALTPGNLTLFGQIGDYLADLADTPLGAVVHAPLAVFAKAILGHGGRLPPVGWLTMALAMVGVLAAITVVLHSWLEGLNRRRGRREYCSCKSPGRDLPRDSILPAKFASIPWGWGVGPLAWRQAVGLRQYAGHVLAALAVPGLLASIPLLIVQEPQVALVQMVGALVFYTSLLLPPALRFDFRRDLDRIVILKTLPIHPLAVVLGQLATPVAAATAFQVVVMAAGMLWRPLPFLSMVMAVALLAQVNVVIFALENLLYLLYPYRLQEESVRIVLRATLIFTAKLLLLTGALAVTFGWSVASQWIASNGLIHAVLGGRQIVFGGGLWLILAFAAIVATAWLLRAYQRFDPSQDIPA